ncbi:MAG: hypothetical protein Q8Q50_10710 [Methylobacter sp.]|nr:hypothetical protein [Methylobacter sp.]
MKHNTLKIIIAITALTAAVNIEAAPTECTKIKDGGITDLQDNPITLGFDQWGYNYQAHMFNGLYDNYSRPETPVTEGLVNLSMKWSDDWLANVDCDSDSKLDRGGPGGTGTSIGWLTNHEEGDYLGNDDQYHHYTYFVKIIYVGPAANPDPWVNARIWNDYAIIEEVYNDPYGGYHGNDRSKLVNPAGLGYWTN